MSIHKKALILLNKAFESYKKFKPKKLTPEDQATIREIILGDHLTFRYILMTGLLGRAVDPKIHPRSIQAKADLQGAYDARSLCHKVWVPFEREYLDSRLGGSNEPYLNKPARFESVDKTNAVRAGKDQVLLDMLYELLERLNVANQATANEAFMLAFKLMMLRDGATITELPLKAFSLTSECLRNFLDEYLRESHGGEVPVSVAGAILALRFDEKNQSVKVHPANQAGTSSNEVGDIDVYSGEIVILPVEVKDKPYLLSDVKHAVNKARYSKCTRLLFVSGRRALPQDNLTSTGLVSESSTDGFDLAFISIDEMFKVECALLNEIGRRKLLELVNKILVEMRCKDETKRYFAMLLTKHGLIR